MGGFQGNLFDLLSDDVFQIHEEVLDETALFKLPTICDKIMNDNPQAKFDGGFKIRLTTSLQGSGSTLEDFWSKLKNAPESLTSLYLTCSEKSAGVMKFHSVRLNKSSGLQFMQAAKDPRTFDTECRNCCMEALHEGGPKGAVIHFYDNLRSKAIVLDNLLPRNHKPNNYYRERQSLVVEDDPLLTCTRIERDMKDDKYFVPEDKSHKAASAGMSPDSVVFQPVNLQSDGNGGNCSLYFNGIEETADNFLYITAHFALSHLCHLNMLTDLPGYYTGISYPLAYLGGLHSIFPVHVEDMSLWSINFNHFGYPKLIILIAPSEASRLSLLLTCYGVRDAGSDCIQQLFHKTEVVFPEWLLLHGFKFKVVIQHPGEFIVFAPNAAHTGGNMGPNLAEACNFASYDWLPFGSVASQGRCQCLVGEGVQFDVTQLIKDHRKDLLPYHKDRRMWAFFRDEHFRQSLIIPPTAFHSSASNTVLSVTPSTCEEKPGMRCPIKACQKVYKTRNKQTLNNHISKRHPKMLNHAVVLQYLKYHFKIK